VPLLLLALVLLLLLVEVVRLLVERRPRAGEVTRKVQEEREAQGMDDEDDPPIYRTPLRDSCRRWRRGIVTHVSLSVLFKESSHAKIHMFVLFL
jgi:hypothetical protein